MSEIKVQSKNFTAEEIKIRYSIERDNFELFRSEVFNLARLIRIWLAIAEAKEKYKRLSHEDFWGWTQQHSILRLIAIDEIKISQGMTYVKRAVENIVSSDQCKNLIKHSQLAASFKTITNMIEPLKP